MGKDLLVKNPKKVKTRRPTSKTPRRRRKTANLSTTITRKPSLTLKLLSLMTLSVTSTKTTSTNPVPQTKPRNPTNHLPVTRRNPMMVVVITSRTLSQVVKATLVARKKTKKNIKKKKQKKKQRKSTKKKTKTLRKNIVNKSNQKQQEPK